jgi:site-specific DNA-methyltransferase (adenine-specific)
MNQLYYGDNLEVLRTHIPDESVDLIYLDPPFNSNAGYNVLFKAPSGTGADASIEAFDDTWTWGPAAQSALMDIASGTNRPLAVMMEAMRQALGENSLMAYLAMMAVRLVELHRVLKPTGSLYLHCDPTASHYLKMVLDGVFGQRNFRNEVAWCYRKWSVSQGQFVRNHDVILFYSKSDGLHTFNTLFVPPSSGTLKRWKGKKQQAVFVDGVRKASSLDSDVSESPMPDWWEISILNPNSKERLGYPTQKPRALLERIISASSNPGDLVLDPFCGCGTAVDAAEKLGRRWIGIDITHLAIGMIEDRMRSGYPGIQFETIGVPKDLASAERLARDDPHQFQQWVCWQVGGYPREKKGGDRGVDGWFNYLSDKQKVKTGVIEVKAGENVNPAMVRGLAEVMRRDKHEFGLFILKAMPTKGMEEAANALPMVETDWGRFPALQFVTLAELFQGLRPKLPPLVSPVKKATRVELRPSHQPGAQGGLEL